tara:strand:- start:70 stop:615 length:546 start_codon:yes stop_codon:yes gene_type:complete
MEDFNWISESEKLYNINDHFNKISHEKIKTIFVYVNESNYIDKISKKYIHITNNTIFKDLLFKTIYDNRIKNPNSVYNFDTATLFHVPIDHDKINILNNSDINDFSFFNSINIDNHLIVPPSLFIFHNINTLIVFYKQKLLDIQPKSILKPINKPKTNKKTKKRVCIKETFRKTKKYNDNL